MVWPWIDHEVLTLIVRERISDLHASAGLAALIGQFRSDGQVGRSWTLAGAVGRALIAVGRWLAGERARGHAGRRGVVYGHASLRPHRATGDRPRRRHHRREAPRASDSCVRFPASCRRR
jgi:hypothetical protein